MFNNCLSWSPAGSLFQEDNNISHWNIQALYHPKRRDGYLVINIFHRFGCEPIKLVPDDDSSRFCEIKRTLIYIILTNMGCKNSKIFFQYLINYLDRIMEMEFHLMAGTTSGFQMYISFFVGQYCRSLHHQCLPCYICEWMLVNYRVCGHFPWPRSSPIWCLDKTTFIFWNRSGIISALKFYAWIFHLNQLRKKL